MREGHSLLSSLRNYRPGSIDLIDRYVRPNEHTAFGEAYGFGSIRSYEDWSDAVPLQTYKDLEPWIRRAAAGDLRVLTAETPSGFEITSGTSNASKLIPVTPMYQRELASALSIWMSEWKLRFKGVFDGPAYWSISPRLGDQNFGFDDDGAYFPEDVRAALAKWLVVPEFSEQGELFEKTAAALLATPNLRSVSVWSPVFFLKIDEALGLNHTWKEHWPELRVVSCWADAQAGMWRSLVTERLGEGVHFEPKGLMATEGVTTIPTDGGHVIANGVHFHEFIDCQSGRVVRNVEPGDRYEVVLTTGSGLYRYLTGDMIEVDSERFVRFIGRSGDTSDLVGEKFDAEQVLDAFRQADDSGFVRINGMGYDVFALRPRRVLEMLRRNMHFAAALDSGQLGAPRLIELPQNWQSLAARFLAESRQAREGDVKLPVLERGELMRLWPG